MEKMTLNGDNWRMQIMGEQDIYGVNGRDIPAVIPGSVYGNLLRQGLMPDPYERMNELDALKLMENAFRFQTVFSLTGEQMAADFLLLRFDGIDTLAEIYLNDILLGHADNMHRVWEFDIRDAAREGENTLRVEISSPTRYIEEENEKVYTGGSWDAMLGFPHLRKAHCMFGWDWGPRLPDAGLFREVSVLSGKKARLEQVYITQNWPECEVADGVLTQNETDDWVDITYDVTVEDFADGEGYEIRTALYDPNGLLIAEKSAKYAADGEEGATAQGREAGDGWDTVTVHNPKRWWPNGYGEQPLYRAEVTLVDGDGQMLDIWSRRIGLRTMTMNREKDQWGECFAHEVNGVKIFAMGADYIPEDNILSRVTPERTRRLLEDAAAANHNCIRVWGGGYYPDDWFFDICDELGLIVWQDFMFACASYELSSAFEANVSAEIRQNIRRLRSHASIGLWCGNNEMETQYEMLAWPQTKKQYYDYIRLYEYIIPKIVEEEDPMTFYWPSSPSSGGNYENSNAENVGDVHYWGVWHGNEPFTAYRKHHYRFLSEFGFQSFPALQTIRRFTEEGDRNIYSRVMEMHQRNTAANGKISNYLSQTYLYPKSFDELLYCSQLLQADAIRYGVEHFRRFRGTCMGTVVWQLNDIWPVASWASVDYYGNWKALQYAEKRMFAPILLSCEEHGEIDQKPNANTLPCPIDVSADLHVANETGEPVNGTVKWSLRMPDSSVVQEGHVEVTVPAYGGTWLPHLNFNGQDPLKVHLEYALLIDGNIVSSGTSLFCAPKHYAFLDPELRVSVEGDVVTVTAKNYAKSVSVETENGVLRLDDNFIDMEAGSRTFRILPSRDFTDDGTMVSGAYRVRSIYEISER